VGGFTAVRLQVRYSALVGEFPLQIRDRSPLQGNSERQPECRQRMKNLSDRRHQCAPPEAEFTDSARARSQFSIDFSVQPTARFPSRIGLGKPARVDRGVPQLVVAPRREHSRKPDEVAERIERLLPGPYIELFARESRPGWDTWGNQTSLFDSGSVMTRRQPSNLIALAKGG
jgi:hypothetical protein